MPKMIAMLRREPGTDRAEFASGYLAAARSLAPRLPSGARLTVNLVDVPAEEAGLRPGGEPSFDAVAEVWLPDDSATIPPELVDEGVAHVFRVDEKEERPYDRTWPDGERSPGIKSFYVAVRNPAMTHDEFARYWGEQHAPLALKIHIGMWRYTRNVVSSALTADAPPFDGMAILHFRSGFDLRERFYDSEEGRAAIAADVAKFSGPGGKALHTSEYILRS